MNECLYCGKLTKNPKFCCYEHTVLYRRTPGNEWSKEVSRKNSGKNGSFYGKHHTEEHKEYISQLLTGREITWKDKISKTLMGHKESPETCMKKSKSHKALWIYRDRKALSIKMSGEGNPNYGNKWTKKQKQKVSGPNNPQWKGGISTEPYCPKFNNEFKERVRKFWNYTCPISHKTEYEYGKKLCVHHVDYDKESCCDIKEFNSTPNLFIAVTNKWNTKFNFNREYWKIMLSNWIMIYYNGQCYLPIGED